MLKMDAEYFPLGENNSKKNFLKPPKTNKQTKKKIKKKEKKPKFSHPTFVWFYPSI